MKGSELVHNSSTKKKTCFLKLHAVVGGKSSSLGWFCWRIIIMSGLIDYEACLVLVVLVVLVES